MVGRPGAGRQTSGPEQIRRDRIDDRRRPGLTGGIAVDRNITWRFLDRSILDNAGNGCLKRARNEISPLLGGAI